MTIGEGLRQAGAAIGTGFATSGKRRRDAEVKEKQDTQDEIQKYQYALSKAGVSADKKFSDAKEQLSYLREEFVKANEADFIKSKSEATILKHVASQITGEDTDKIDAALGKTIETGGEGDDFISEMISDKGRQEEARASLDNIVDAQKLRLKNVTVGGIKLEMPKSKSDIEDALKEKMATKKVEAIVATDKSVKSAAMKEAQTKEDQFRRAELKLVHTGELLKRVYKRTNKNHPAFTAAGIKPGEGLSAKAYGALVKWDAMVGTNPWVKTFKGDLVNTAMSLMRMQIPGRSMEFVEAEKLTLPDLSGIITEDMTQIVESATAAFDERAALARHVDLNDKQGEYIYKTRAEREQARDEYRSNFYIMFAEEMVETGLMSEEQADQTLQEAGLPGFEKKSKKKETTTNANQIQITLPSGAVIPISVGGE